VKLLDQAVECLDQDVQPLLRDDAPHEQYPSAKLFSDGGRLTDPGDLFRGYTVVDDLDPVRELRPRFSDSVCEVIAAADYGIDRSQSRLHPAPVELDQPVGMHVQHNFCSRVPLLHSGDELREVVYVDNVRFVRPQILGYGMAIMTKIPRRTEGTALCWKQA